MTEKELKDYKHDFLAVNATPEVSMLRDNQIWRNKPNTSNRYAWKGVAWIEYWQAFTEPYSNKMTCSCCGKTIFADINAEDARFYICSNQDVYSETEEVQACGGHVELTADEGDEYSGGAYITPLCKKCNNSTVDSLELKEGSLLVSEVGATIVEE